LEIEANELMGVLGHNGAGKTTLINILTGVIAPDEAEGSEIIIDRNPIADIDEIRKHIGVCSQFDILWSELTAEQHLYMFARLKGIAEQQVGQKIDEMLEFVSLLP
jgi:ABC-type multidrug transport system ATPase subunit